LTLDMVLIEMAVANGNRTSKSAEHSNMNKAVW